MSLGQQGSTVSARDAGKKLLGSTFLGGYFAILFWFMLDRVANLWMSFLWKLLFRAYFSSKLYQLIPSRFPASYWQNAAVTMLILLGSAVEDSANGKDVYAAFAARMGLFVAVTLYAHLAAEKRIESMRGLVRARDFLGHDFVCRNRVAWCHDTCAFDGMLELSNITWLRVFQ